jgi:UDP-glucuronate 4-epimerase
MRVLVTGGVGFIGSHLCERLLKDGYEVAVVDDLNDYYSPALKLENLSIIRAAGSFPFFKCDICDREALTEILGRWRPDAVVHLAARAGVRPSLEQPLLYERVNVGGTLNLLEACRQHGISKLVFASSSSVYGAATAPPFSEECQVNRPVSPYAATKLAGEQLCYTYFYLYGIRCVCLRLFTVYGPRQRPDLAIRKFADRIAQGLPIPVFGDGSSGRDYTFVEDTVAGVIGALEYDCGYDIINLGNSAPVTLLDMIKTLEEFIGRKAKIEWLPDQSGDVPITCADIRKAGRILGYSPKTPFPAGIRKFLDWHFSRVLAAAGAS